MKEREPDGEATESAGLPTDVQKQVFGEELERLRALLGLAWESERKTPPSPKPPSLDE